MDSPQRVRRYCHLGEGWKALRDLPQAPAAGTMGGRRGGGWASARSGLEVEEAGELGAGPWGLARATDQSRGVLARENPGRRWRGPGRRRGEEASPPGRDREGEEARAGVCSRSPGGSAPTSELRRGSGRRQARGPRGEAGGGPRAPGGLSGLSPLLSSSPLPGGRPGSSRRAAPASAAPAATALSRLLAARRGCSLARSRVAAGAVGIAAASSGAAGRGGAERRGEPGVRGGREGGWAPWEGERERASERGISAQLECASEPARAAAGRTDRGQTAPGSRAAAARLAARAALPRAPGTPPRLLSCVSVCEVISEGSGLGPRSSSTDRPAG